ncbi:hypothetical protein HYFRA_00010050 [Hymenoscyphus fraxineus]|uniref:Tyrosinase copper-binding domain-containing protein n=1 Tax=Hymenoscyphus fraxineus TaxID=746836 RepID=A0A9N9KTX2_9HELO|nr:hypothetical protein HYFRA_00010050 [Hymenoscyphus fraxineus]
MRLLTQTRAAVLTAFGALLIQSVLSMPSETPQQTRHGRYDYGPEGHAHLKRQASDNAYTATTGLPYSGRGPGGSAPLRLEVRELEKNATMWTLYLLGLDWMQSINQEVKYSYYQLMGIHGRPFLTYDQVSPAPGMENSGYCHHIDILFPTWHRPYNILYEQTLQYLMLVIANMYPEGFVRDRYVEAAQSFRIPYWDWAVVPEPGQSVFPSSVQQSSVRLDGPKGRQIIDNPLFTYIFQPLDTAQLPDEPFNKFPTTMRYPTTSDANAVSQNSLVAKQLDNSAPSFRSRIYNLLTNYHDYATFSNTAWIPASQNKDFEKFDSLESIHDQVHGLVGSGGHMSYIDYSGFDPIFMLVHCNMDRIFAIWQTLNPSDYVNPETSLMGSYTVPKGQLEDTNTPLSPFRMMNGQMWNSTGIRYTTDFGYAYPETANGTGVDIRAQAVSAVNKLYGPNPQGTVPGVIARDTSNGLEYREWIANIRVLKYALDGPFFIHIFLGNFSADPFQWSFEPNLVGTHSIFVKAMNGKEEPCNCNADWTTGTIPLTAALSKAVEAKSLKSLNPEDVEPYLERNLRYKLSYLNDKEVMSDVKSLEITVVSAPVKKASTETELPEWGNFTGNFTVGAG